VVFGGHSQGNPEATHNASFVVDLDTESTSQLALRIGTILGFETIVYKDTLYLIGGDSLVP
jgi:hypothetical protein